MKTTDEHHWYTHGKDNGLLTTQQRFIIKLKTDFHDKCFYEREVDKNVPGFNLDRVIEKEKLHQFMMIVWSNYQFLQNVQEEMSKCCIIRIISDVTYGFIRMYSYAFAQGM